MRIRFYIVVLLLYQANDTTGQPVKSTSQKNIKSYSLEIDKNSAFDIKPTHSFCFKDSLIKHSNADSLPILDEFSPAILFIGKANNTSFGIWLPDSILFFYQRLNNEWKCTDSLSLELYSFTKCIDLNGDKKKIFASQQQRDMLEIPSIKCFCLMID